MTKKKTQSTAKAQSAGLMNTAAALNKDVCMMANAIQQDVMT